MVRVPIHDVHTHMYPYLHGNEAINGWHLNVRPATYGQVQVSDAWHKTLMIDTIPKFPNVFLGQA